MYLPQKVLAIIQAIGDLSFGGSTLRAPPLNSAPGATATVQGFDISHWQATVDFQVAYDSGARFVIIKATEGVRTVDAKFVDHTVGAVNAGLYHGAYHFARTAASSGDVQANFFLANGGAWVDDGQTLSGMVDLENNPDGTQCYGLTHAGMRMWITDFVDTYLGVTGRFPMIYTTNNWWRTCTGNYGGFSTLCPLVLARYAGAPGPVPGGWSSYTIWQNSDHYAFGGDSDIFNGDEIDLKDLVTG